MEWYHINDLVQYVVFYLRDVEDLCKCARINTIFHKVCSADKTVVPFLQYKYDTQDIIFKREKLTTTERMLIKTANKAIVHFKPVLSCYITQLSIIPRYKTIYLSINGLELMLERTIDNTPREKFKYQHVFLEKTDRRLYTLAFVCDLYKFT
jgi:hypothetical protein